MPRDDLILAFDTSAAHCAAALVSGGQVLAHRSEEMARGQAERLFPLLEELLAEAGAGWKDLNRIGVGIGPGNFTGTRISVSAARGLALSLGIPALGVSTFEALAHGLPRPLIASVDARAGRLYLQRLADGTEEPPLLVSRDSLPSAWFAPGMLVVGHAAPELAALLGGQSVPAAVPLAQAIAAIAATRTADRAARPAPLYLRPADAAPPRDSAPVILP